jgi:uncharacterized protein (DUF1697 family)
MTAYVALLRAVNVGGTGKLPMAELVRICEAAGLRSVRTYIASGNVVFQSDDTAAAIRSDLEHRLAGYAKKPVGVMIRTGAEMAGVLARNPFADKPGNRTAALFLDAPASPATLDGITGQRAEQLRLGQREIYIFYGDGMAQSRLRIPAAKHGTARNMNTVAKLADMSS